jgi:hypothetical protein
MIAFGDMCLRFDALTVPCVPSDTETVSRSFAGSGFAGSGLWQMIVASVASERRSSFSTDPTIQRPSAGPVPRTDTTMPGSAVQSEARAVTVSSATRSRAPRSTSKPTPVTPLGLSPCNCA